MARPMGARSSEWWLVSVPLTRGNAQSTWAMLRDKTEGEVELATSYRFNVPELRVGTLDSLLALSDDLVKINTFAENVTNMIARQLQDLTDGEPLSIEGMPVESALTRFVWDEAKYPVKSHLRETVDKISTHISKMEDALKSRTADYNSLKGQLSQLSRKAQGSLLVRDLGTIVKESDVVESENLTTLMVVVGKYSQKDWLDAYETLSQFVVPRSSKCVAEEGDYALYTVVVFRRVADDFRTNARSKGFQVRDYSYDPEARAARATQEGEIRDGLATKQSALLAWCRASYVEAFTSWVHLSAVRVFTESIMRFGLPPQFLATLIRPQPKCEKKLRTTLSGLFAGKDAHHWQETEDTTAASMGVGALSADDMHPYVSLTLTLAGTS